MNANLYGYKDKWILVDFGMTFAGPYYPGVDLIFPDMRFIEDRVKDLLGIVLTHGHEDHVGALPYLLEDLNVPLYATAFTAEFIRRKMTDDGPDIPFDLNVIEPQRDFRLGDFTIRYIPQAHSIPEANSLLIETPAGRIFHTGDWKLDDSPVVGVANQEKRLRQIGDLGIRALIGDSTNALNPNASGYEKDVAKTLEEIISSQTGRVLVTTFASNAARLENTGRIAQKTGRRIVLAGRSMERIISVGRATGYFKDYPEIVPLDQAKALAPRETLILATGCQGEAMAALSRIASGKHGAIRLDEGDCVLFSSKAIPGNEMNIGLVQNQLAQRGVVVITEKNAPIHVSGHPGQPEMRQMLNWIKPEVVIPVHGEARHMLAHAKLASGEIGCKTLTVQNGQMVRIAPDPLEIVDEVPCERLILDGDVLIPANADALIQRRRLMRNGLLTVTLVLGKKGLAAEPLITSHGLPLSDYADEFYEQCIALCYKAVDKLGVRDKKALKEEIRIGLRRKVKHETGKRPVTEVQCIIP